MDLYQELQVERLLIFHLLTRPHRQQNSLPTAAYILRKVVSLSTKRKEASPKTKEQPQVSDQHSLRQWRSIDL